LRRVLNVVNSRVGRAVDDITRNSLHHWLRSSPFAGANAAYLEELYEAYLLDPASIDPSWRRHFEALPRVAGSAHDVSHDEVRDRFRRLARAPLTRSATAAAAAPVDSAAAQKQVHVLQYINAHRVRGHQGASLDPLGLADTTSLPELDIRFHGLTDNDLDTVFETGSLVGPKRATLREISDIVRRTYCGTVGAEYMHITDTQEKRWLQSSLESVRGVPPYPPEVRRRLLERLTAAEGLEHYLHAKYVGQKRFSLEGSESLIPMLDELLLRAGAAGVKEVVIGMAHRGRLNVLVNIMGKTPTELFKEFEGKAQQAGTGDVKYHMGFSSDVETPGGPLHLALAFNPSHLEIVNPVVQGSVRARQDRRHDRYGAQVLPIVIHGDAAFAGQGVVTETFNLSQARGYTTRGTVHIVVNNQIGFTTSARQDARSTLYCTDAAKAIGAPIFHVNGDDPEAVLFVTEIALDYRMTFRKDVVIDLVCYRRHGHSEADEPTVTQPLMYQRIRALPTTRALYAQKLLDAGVIDRDTPVTLLKTCQQALDAGTCVMPRIVPKEKADYAYATDWSAFTGGECGDVDTRLDLESIRRFTDRMLHVPEGFELHPNVAKVFDNRRKMAAGALGMDWGYAETLAYAALLHEGFSVRLSGQDSGRGTFFHRHAVLHGVKDDATYVPLRTMFEGQPNFSAINSPLTEEAVLAFEYGYATADPKTLVIWEAQFGDFANNAQVVMDQFISAGEQKWNRLCGLAMFLPHGYEGQGPEHSSARLERYLQLCAQRNMFVAVPTTPAQFFHLIRRQMRWPCRKPLVVMTPKSLLRHRLSVSNLEDLTQHGFQMVIGENNGHDPAQVRTVVMCSGKVYYDVLEKQREQNRHDVAILRIEQLYPFPIKELADEFERYPNARRFVWCQEEPKNQGAWYPSQHHIWPLLPPGVLLEYAGRPMMASPAVGDYALHVRQLNELVAQALGPA
jgi:2-oxoglutarate dehydrogenase E1 component